MKRIVATFAAVLMISTTFAASAFADGGRRHVHGPDVADVLLWPITAALTIPAAIIGTVAQATLPHPVVYANPAPVYDDPAAYAGPRAYYAPRTYVERRVYSVPRDYYESRGCDDWGHRHNRHRW